MVQNLSSSKVLPSRPARRWRKIADFPIVRRTKSAITASSGEIRSSISAAASRSKIDFTIPRKPVCKTDGWSTLL
jgi:hypothetical protein